MVNMLFWAVVIGIPSLFSIVFIPWTGLIYVHWFLLFDGNISDTSQGRQESKDSFGIVRVYILRYYCGPPEWPIP